LRKIEFLVRVTRWVLGFGLMLAAAVLGALAFAHEDAPLLVGCAVLTLGLLFPLSHAAAESLEEFWRWNQESALLPGVARDVLRVINRHLLQLSKWQDADNAQRSAFDPTIEALLERRELTAARKLAAEKLWGAHCSGDTRNERMYRRYMFVVDKMRKEQAA
jgi:hypothetical protein